MEISGLENQLLQKIKAEGGRAESLLRISADLGVSYFWSWQAINRLEKMGVMVIKRKPGNPLTISLTPEA